MLLEYDYHVHSNYSDGWFLNEMIESAKNMGLNGIGFSDHCNVFNSDQMREYKYRFGLNLDLCYDRRRQAIDSFRQEYDMKIFNSVEMDYDPKYESEIKSFLNTKNFDYSIGSVHFVDNHHILHSDSFLNQLSYGERQKFVDNYVNNIINLIDSELFEVVGHLDVIERVPHLRGMMSQEQYHNIASSLRDSQTLPEINAGELSGDYNDFHPKEDFLKILIDYNIDFVPGSDSHFPSDIQNRIPEMSDCFHNKKITPVEII